MSPIEIVDIARNIAQDDVPIEMVAEIFGVLDTNVAINELSLDRKDSTVIAVANIISLWHYEQFKKSTSEPRRVLAKILFQLGKKFAFGKSNDESQKIMLIYERMAKGVDLYYK